MNKKMVFHGCLLGGLFIYTLLAWNSFQQSQEDQEKRLKEGDRWAETEAVEKRADTAEGMIKVAIPLLLTTLYAAGLTVAYGLPALVEKVTEGIIGSTAQMEPDPTAEAREAVEEGEYADAIEIYHRVWRKNPSNRRLLMEIVNIQRKHLKNPMLAASSLEEGLEDHEWDPDDAAFLLFRLAEIYEEDLKDEDKVREVMQRVVDDLEGTRHAGNAAQKLREMETD